MGRKGDATRNPQALGEKVSPHLGVEQADFPLLFEQKGKFRSTRSHGILCRGRTRQVGVDLKIG